MKFLSKRAASDQMFFVDVNMAMQNKKLPKNLRTLTNQMLCVLIA